MHSWGIILCGDLFIMIEFARQGETIGHYAAYLVPVNFLQGMFTWALDFEYPFCTTDSPSAVTGWADSGWDRQIYAEKRRERMGGGRGTLKQDAFYILWVWELEIPVQVPAIRTCFMSIDEIARIFSKSQSLYRGGEFGKAFIGT